MLPALALRTQIEAALAHCIPSALTPAPRTIRSVVPTGIAAIDDLLDGGLPLGAITEMAGPECSGRTSIALIFLAQITRDARVCAWIDASDAFHPESAAATGVNLVRLLWVPCGSGTVGPRKLKPLSRIEQALRVTDLLLHAGGFSAIVLDLGSIAPEAASRIPLATWFRYRAAAERTQAVILLLTQHACAKSAAGLVLHLQELNLQLADHNNEAPTVLTLLDNRIEKSRERFAPTNVIPLRKPPQSDRTATWRTRTSWAGRA